MDWVLSPVREIADAYFDDVIIGTDVPENCSEEEALRLHDGDLRRVLDA